ncbi:MAG: DUF2845 domain-containing protein [Methylophilaceae bacterium]
MGKFVLVYKRFFMVKLLLISYLSLFSSILLSETTQEIRTSSGDLVSIGDDVGTLQDKLGEPRYIRITGTETNGKVSRAPESKSATYHESTSIIEFWTYIVDRNQYTIKIKGGQILSIDWRRLPA